MTVLADEVMSTGRSFTASISRQERGGGDGMGQLSSTKIIIGIDCDGEYKLTIILDDKFWAYVELIIFYSDLHSPFLKHRPAILLLILSLLVIHKKVLVAIRVRALRAPVFSAHFYAKRGAARPPPAIAPSPISSPHRWD